MAQDKPYGKPRTGGKPGGKPGMGGGRFGKKGMLMKRKKCRFCADKIEIDYKNINLLRGFLTERGKMLSGHVTGTCAKHQRLLATAIKRARVIALLPYAVM